MKEINYNKLADIVLPGVSSDIDALEARYPKRTLKDGAVVTRFAPSPTGLPHIGNLFACYVEMQSAKQSGGVFILRIEDTDTKRTVDDGIEKIITILSNFGIDFDERPSLDGEDKGTYGPYIQSHRKEIYQTCVKHLIKKGLAYPCFCSHESLDEMRKQQGEENVPAPGYFGKWAVCRDMSLEDVENKIKNGDEFVIRLKSEGTGSKSIILKDLIRGEIEFPENIFDVVILKTDGLPTYHFAHVTDDHFMRTTHVIRADEWLSSYPIHHELFGSMGYSLPEFAHVPALLKIDGNSKRKISKRKDSESALEFYGKEGYITGALMEYIAHIANSSFESWRHENPTLSYKEYWLRLENMSSSGAVFDILKLDDVSREYISRLTSAELYDIYLSWAKIYDPDIESHLTKQPEYFTEIFGIERGGTKPRKDLHKLSMIKDYYFYFIDDYYENAPIDLDTLTKGKTSDYKAALKHYLSIYDPNDDKDEWFNKIKATAAAIGYAPETKLYKKNPESYKGQISEVASFIRLSLTKMLQTPDLYSISKVMGNHRVTTRIEKAIKD